MGFMIRWFLSKLKLFSLELPHILKMIRIKDEMIKNENEKIKTIWGWTGPSSDQTGAGLHFNQDLISLLTSS